MNRDEPLKSSGIKGALRVYRVLYETDRQTLILLLPVAVLKAFRPYISLLATAYVLNGFIAGYAYGRLLTASLAGVALNYVIDLLQRYFTKRQKVRNDVYVPKIYIDKAEKYMSMDYLLLESPAVNAVNNRINRDNQWGSGFFNLSWYLGKLLDSVFGFAAGAIMLVPLFLETGAAGVLLFMTALIAFALGVSYLRSRFIERKLTGHLNSTDPRFDMKISLYYVYKMRIADVLKTARIYGVKPLLEKYLADEWPNLELFNKIFTQYSCASGFTGAAVSGLLTAAAYMFVAARAVTGAVSAGSVVRYAGTVYNMADSFFGLTSALDRLIDQTDRIQSTLDLMELSNVMYKGTIPVEKRQDNEYEIEFHNVSFRYPGCMGEQSAEPDGGYSLRNFSLKLRIGQKFAVVGMNGSGKTTMIKLLCRLYDPTEGVITLNGVDIKKYNYEEYLGIFSVVFQDFKLLSFTLSENIACSAEADAGRAREALEKVGLSERVRAMPKGLDTYVYNDFDKGVEISGGEAQKLALARALYKNATFIVLDEPTAALDPVAEFEIYSKFDEIVGDKTAIYISHRLSSCRFCDDIAVFHEGRLVQRGSHDALLAEPDGKYYELWNAQAQYYNDKGEAI